MGMTILFNFMAFVVGWSALITSEHAGMFHVTSINEGSPMRTVYMYRARSYVLLTIAILLSQVR